jgi:hypothetical protein
MVVAEAPEWLLEQITKCLRSFYWVGKKKVNGRQYLVAWENVCKPTRYGGLGIKDLRLQVLALRVRCEWLKLTNPLRP